MKSRKMKIACIIQARTGSTRLPKKILKKILGKEILIHVIERVLNSKKIDEIIVATTNNIQDIQIEKLIERYNNPRVKIFRGSEEDVLDRYYQAAKKEGTNVIVRITSDCPLIDWEIIDKIIQEFLKGDYDYVSNVLDKRTFPRGLDVEVFSFDVLKRMWKEFHEKKGREHVTAHIRENKNKFRTKNVENKINLSNLRWTLDEIDDLRFIKRVYEELYIKNKKFKTNDVLDLLNKKPELIKINEHVEQKENIKNETN